MIEQNDAFIKIILKYISIIENKISIYIMQLLSTIFCLCNKMHHFGNRVNIDTR